jgi:hypothetical protein
MSRKPILHPVCSWLPIFILIRFWEIRKFLTNVLRESPCIVGKTDFFFKDIRKQDRYSKNKNGESNSREFRCSSSERKRPYSRVLYLVLFNTSLESESVILY